MGRRSSLIVRPVTTLFDGDQVEWSSNPKFPGSGTELRELGSETEGNETTWNTTDDDEKELTATFSSSSEDTSEYPTGARLIFIIVALVLSIFLMSLDMTIVATAIPKITDEFDGLSDVSWYSSAFFMTLGGFQSAWGKAYKYFPLKTSFLAAISTFELGSLLCGIAPDSIAFIVGRAIAGVGAAGIGSGAYTIVAFAAEPKKRPMFTSIIGASYGFAAVVGPLIGGAFSDKVSWRWCFYINLPIGGLSAAIILFFFSTPASAAPAPARLLEKLVRMDPIGVALVMAAMVSFILALQYGGQTHAWDSATVVGLLVAFVGILVVFGVWEYFQNDRAMMPARFLVDRTYLVSSLFAFFFAGAYFLIIYYLPIYFQSIDNVSPTESGVRNLPLILAVMIATISSGIFISSTGIATPLAVVGTAFTVASSVLIYTLEIGSSSGKWIGFQIIGGIGWGLAYQIPIITGQATAPLEDVAEVTSIILFFQTIGGAFLVSAAQSAFVNVLLKTLPFSAPDVNPFAVVVTGSTELRQVFTPEQVPGILVAYMQGLKIAFSLAIGSTGLALIIVVFSKWSRLNTAAITGGVA